MKQVTINRLEAFNFKNHRQLAVDFGSVNRIAGQNGEGKSSVGEAITWALYGVDMLGNQMTKNLSPEPTNYEYDRVEVRVLLSVDGTQVLLGRMIEGGDTKYYINETPKKATEYKELVESLFDKNLFLSLFNPAYFFSQKWEDQRSQLLKSVLPPANSEVFAELPKPQADKLAELLKKKTLADLEAQHKDNKNRQDKALIAAKERVKTLREQLAGLPPEIDETERERLQAQQTDIDAKIKAKEAQQREAMLIGARIERLTAERNGAKERANTAAAQFKSVKEKPIADTCDKCGQPLDEHTVQNVQKHRDNELATIKGQYDELVARFKELGSELSGLEAADFNPSDLRLMYDSRNEIAGKLQSTGAHGNMLQQIEQAEQHEKSTHDSYTESVFILDSVKAFKAKEAELMAAKVGGLFTTLTLQLFQTNKGDGEQKPFFEIEMDGKPYRKLSVGEKIRAGLELIEVMSKQNDIVAPCMIDNAESYTGTISVRGQAIICRAVAGKKFEFTTEE